MGVKCLIIPITPILTFPLKGGRNLNCTDFLTSYPSLPVTKDHLADEAVRTQWIETKMMQVLSLISEAYPDTTLDIFITEPFDFEHEYNQATEIQLDRDLNVRVVSIPTLIKMKQLAGRPRDIDDIQHLSWILEDLKK